MITSTKDLAGQLTSFSITLVTEVCINCGIPFAIPQNYQQRLVQTQETFCCPNGHKQHYAGKTEAQKLREQLQQKEREVAQLSASKIQLEGQLQKVAAGKCPCCGKLYKHLQSHMKNKHPHALKK